MFLCFDAIDIYENPYFDSSYGVVFGILLVIYLVAIVLGLVYICGNVDAMCPLSFLLAAISNLLIGIWIIIYIYGIYQEPVVKKPVAYGDSASDTYYLK